MIRTYSELNRLKTLEERFNYLKLDNGVGVETFGFDRYLNQIFYKDKRWKSIRNKVIIRDNGCELGLEDYEIGGPVYVHHMNPITIHDLKEWSPYLIEPEYLICMSYKLHNAIHFGDSRVLSEFNLTERSPNDTKLW